MVSAYIGPMRPRGKMGGQSRLHRPGHPFIPRTLVLHCEVHQDPVNRGNLGFAQLPNDLDPQNSPRLICANVARLMAETSIAQQHRRRLFGRYV